MPLAELALHAAQRGDGDFDGLLRRLDEVMSSERTTGVLGALVDDTRNWARGCHEALAEQPDAALHHLELMKHPALTRLAAYDRLEVAIRAGRQETAAGWLAELADFADQVQSPHAQ